MSPRDLNSPDRTPEEIYAAMRAVPAPTCPTDPTQAERLAWLEATRDHYAAHARAWDEMSEALMKRPGLTAWMLAAVFEAGSRASQQSREFDRSLEDARSRLSARLSSLRQSLRVAA